MAISVVKTMRVPRQCPFCEGDLVPKWTKRSFSRCISCNLIIRNPLPDDEELDALYEASWRAPEANSHETGNMDERLAAQYVKELTKSLGRNDVNGLKILDFGAGKAALMGALQTLGADVNAMAVPV
jgi:hypothetical protein